MASALTRKGIVRIKTTIGNLQTYLYEASEEPDGSANQFYIDINSGDDFEMSSAVTRDVQVSPAVFHNTGDFKLIGTNNQYDLVIISNNICQLRVSGSTLPWFVYNAYSLTQFELITKIIVQYGDNYYLASLPFSTSVDFEYGVSHASTGSLGFYSISYNESGTTNVTVYNSTVFNNVTSDIFSNSTYIEGTDPYSGGGTSGNDSTGGVGGTGTLDGTSDNIEVPNLPTLSASSTGFITLFTPSVSELNRLADYMWNNDLFDLDTWKKIFDNPMDAIIGLSIVPVSVPSGGTSDVTVGNIITTVSMTKASTQFVEVNCGTLNVEEYWGAYLDYDPYTKCEIYLPYCGTHPIKTDDIMGKTIQVIYHIDILSGACVAYVKCGDSVLYSYIGQCSSSIPVTGQDMTQVINGALNIAGQGALFVASGGMSAPIAASTAVKGVNSTVSNVMNMKPQVERSGAISGTGALMAIQTPYLIVTRPRQCLPLNQNQYTGYPSYVTRTISSLSGYTSFLDVHLTNIEATEDEKEEIMNLLLEGVIL